MDPKSEALMNEYYSKLLGEHGDSLEALVYRAPEQQDKRFALMTDIGPIPHDASVLDVGCGLGHLCEYLRRFGWKGEYTGIDINPDMVKTAQERLPDATFQRVNILEDEFDKKFDYVFCGATIQHRPQFADSYEYMKQMVTKMFSLSNKALTFDVFSGRAEYEDDDKLYIEPSRLLEFCYTLTSRVVLRNDARPFELMMYLHREEDRDEFNIYKTWAEETPRIV
ncbi:class I SAM-dependent methyltransferase [Candidatus Omnitrophota bacterium]